MVFLMSILNSGVRKATPSIFVGVLMMVSTCIWGEVHDQKVGSLHAVVKPHENDAGGGEGIGSRTEEGGDTHEREHEGDIALSKAEIKNAGIQTIRLEKQLVNRRTLAFGEVRLNQYETVKISPSMTTRIEKRHVFIGDHVKKGDLLVTLHTIATADISANVLATADLAASSAELAVSIAEVKGELATAKATWKRIQSLGKDSVSGKRYTEAKLAKERAQAKLHAYGKSQSEVNTLLKSSGEYFQQHFELRASQSGTVIKDDFVLGQTVSPEDVLFVISDMSSLWINANVKPVDRDNIAIGSSVIVPLGDTSQKGKVIYVGRVLDEITRTLPVRIEINSAGASLYPGQFVKTFINTKETRNMLVVPAEAVLRGSDGDWLLFIEEGAGQFEPKEIKIVENLGDRVIIEGVKEGTRIVSKGAFFVQSELAKSGFEVHNH
jgi:RND family efflux transporter MFP subunit